MSFPWPSLWTTVRLYLAPATRPSSCGTPLPSASTPFKMMATPTGCRVSGSHPTTPTPSLCLQDGTGLSRFVTLMFVFLKIFS